MTEQIITWALGILATLFGGTSLYQWLSFRSYKRQQNALADQAEIKSLSEIIRQNQEEIGRLSQRLILADQRAVEQENKYNMLYDKYDKLRDEFEQYKLNHK